MKSKQLIAFTVLSLFIILSCKKYPEGPALSLRSRTARVANTWKVEKVTENGVDFTSALNNLNYTETYDKDGNYSYSTSFGVGSGKWAFENKDTQIKRSGVSGQSSETLTILKLKENSFWYKYEDGNDIIEFHLIPKN